MSANKKTYIYWIRRYILFHDQRHPKDMESVEIEALMRSQHSICPIYYSVQLIVK
ncbi:phage integrase N-terminal SAM-like domain-containing protein [Nostoc sp.]|uniref:phage integrase N-terminal SAM-like domain-containing protein n=1 Tax=Nostoc sp. TaxID=1180 RepID=UPI003FA58EEF